MNIPTVSLVKCNSYDCLQVVEAVRRSVELLGGVSAFVRPRSSVLVKPNLLMAKEPSYCIDTHPEVVRAVVRLLKDINCRIYLGDGPSLLGRKEDVEEEVYEKSGMKEVARSEGIELVRFDKRRWRRNFPFTSWLDTCQHVVSVPKFKTHQLTTLTGAVKNLFGLITGTYKTELHLKHYNLEEFCKIIVDIYEEVRPSLTVIDGVMALEGDGPGTSGKPRHCGLVLAGADCVALDSVLAKVMGIEPLDVPTTKAAAARLLGESRLEKIAIAGDPLEDFLGRPFKLPQASLVNKLPPPLIKMAKRLVKHYPRISDEKCIRCQACIQVCPNKAISMHKERVVIDYKRCIACFCCQESCPASAIQLKRSILAYIMGI